MDFHIQIPLACTEYTHQTLPVLIQHFVHSGITVAEAALDVTLMSRLVSFRWSEVVTLKLYVQGCNLEFQQLFLLLKKVFGIFLLPTSSISNLSSVVLC